MSRLKIGLLLTTMMNFVLPTVSKAQSASMVIIDVRRNITLSDDEKPYKDFYISINNQSQVKVNQEVNVVRKLSVRDSTGAQSFGEIKIPLAKLKIIATYDRVAIAREVEFLSREKLPMVENFFIMSGDEVQ